MVNINFMNFIILIIAGALFIACLFEDIDLSGKIKTIWEAFDEKSLYGFYFYYNIFYRKHVFLIWYYYSKKNNGL